MAYGSTFFWPRDDPGVPTYGRRVTRTNPSATAKKTPEIPLTGIIDLTKEDGLRKLEATIQLLEKAKRYRKATEEAQRRFKTEKVKTPPVQQTRKPTLNPSSKPTTPGFGRGKGLKKEENGDLQASSWGMPSFRCSQPPCKGLIKIPSQEEKEIKLKAEVLPIREPRAIRRQQQRKATKMS
jgi:hypothetical protein